MKLSRQNKKKELAESVGQNKLKEPLFITLEKQLAKSLLWGFVAITLSIWFSEIALAEFSVGNFFKAFIDPAKKSFDDYYGWLIAIFGGAGVLLNRHGDLRDRIVGFGIGATLSGLVVAGVKSGYGLT